MNFEIVLVPDGNQMKIIRKLQSEICLKNNAIPTFPLFARFSSNENLIEKSNLIKKCSATKIIFTENEIFLSIKVDFSSEFSESIIGKIKIGKFFNRNETYFEKEISLFFPVFKFSKVEIVEDENNVEWKIFSEKWVKVKK